MPISCLSIGFAACQSCLTGKVNYSHWVEDRGRIIPFSHANSSIISYKKCINGWLKFVSTKPIRTTSRKYCFPWSKVFLPTECYDFGVPDLLRNHRYALRLGWPDSSSSTLKTEENMILYWEENRGRVGLHKPQSWWRWAMGGLRCFGWQICCVKLPMHIFGSYTSMENVHQNQSVAEAHWTCTDPRHSWRT
jgi:hypothetical protein